MESLDSLATQVTDEQLLYIETGVDPSDFDSRQELGTIALSQAEQDEPHEFYGFGD